MEVDEPQDLRTIARDHEGDINSIEEYIFI